MRSQRLLIAATALTSSLVGCTNPRAEAATAQALNDAANEIGGLRNDVAQLQTDLDSLRSVVAKHDSVLARIVAASPK
jgi:outer membrane murein-binding lipoprotein Lpp